MILLLLLGTLVIVGLFVLLIWLLLWMTTLVVNGLCWILDQILDKEERT